MIIRKEIKADYDEVYELIKAAFKTAEHSGGDEQDLVVRLRNSEEFIPELSLVAVESDVIIGHILFTKIKIGERTEIALAPLSVHPDHQKKGVGTALMKEGHKIATELGYEFSIVLGSNKYYPRLGYIKASTFGITAPFDVPDENFMAINFLGNDTKLNNEVVYSKEFT